MGAHLLDELDDRALLQLGPRVTEFLQRGEARVGVAQDAVTITDINPSEGATKNYQKQRTRGQPDRP